MSKLITTNDLQDILNEALPTPRYGGVQTASWTANSSAANNVKLTDSIHLTAGTYVITVKYPGISATLSTAIQYGTGTSLDSFCTSAGAAYSSHSYVINIPSEMDIYVATATSSSITYTYKERGGLRAIQIAESKASSNEVDYIVEQGTSGIWTYRKWNSGIAECWGIKTGSATNYASGFGGYGYNSGAIPFPSDLFNGVPIVNYTIQCADSFALCGTQTSDGTTKTQCYVYWIRGTTGTVTYSARIYAIGTWK